LDLERQHERLLRQFCKKYPTKFEKMEIDTIAFGALLYEMATGFILKNLSQLDSYSQNTPKEIIPIVDLIFKDTEKTPTLEEITQIPFFANIKLRRNTEPVVFESKVSEYLTSAREATKKLHGGYVGRKK